MNTRLPKAVLHGSFVFFAAGAMLISGCAKDGGEEEAKSPFGTSGIPPKLRGSAGAGGTPIIAGGNARSEPIQITPEEDIVFTDPDNPDAGIPELERLMAAPKKGPWEDSETLARQEAAREGKPILIWFTDSARSPMCKALSQELFATSEFGKWAEDHVVRLRIDTGFEVDDTDLSLDEKITRKTDIANYVKKLKKRYKVLGHPTVLMLNPSGEVLWRDTGYKRGEGDFYWGLIKQAEAASAYQYTSWRKSLEGKGYREWEGKKGKKVFAKLVSYSEGKLILIEPGGERYKTDESKLSKKDRKWIEEQKALRGIE
ncbi:thioredoxin fold domain-containing protein [Luteolibacter sp. AS25]|uniref:thioredoxin fold domain-containing protein n=1 Tax=Luteolibacter sp. AS25 TaxID=3135776 RepID=UPI00398AD19B